MRQGLKERSIADSMGRIRLLFIDDKILYEMEHLYILWLVVVRSRKNNAWGTIHEDLTNNCVSIIVRFSERSFLCQVGMYISLP